MDFVEDELICLCRYRSIVNLQILFRCLGIGTEDGSSSIFYVTYIHVSMNFHANGDVTVTVPVPVPAT
jgi:hypothetical protein